MSNAFVIIKMCYVHNQWYDIFCATLYISCATLYLCFINLRSFKICFLYIILYLFKALWSSQNLLKFYVLFGDLRNFPFSITIDAWFTIHVIKMYSSQSCIEWRSTVVFKKIKFHSYYSTNTLRLKIWIAH